MNKPHNIKLRNVKQHNIKHQPIAQHQDIVQHQPIRSKTVSLFSQPYLDQYNQCYKNIVTINLLPQGPLEAIVRKVTFPPLSEFKQPGPCSPLKTCGLALISLGRCNTNFNSNSNCCSDLMVVDEVPTLFSFLVSNGYSIDTSITKMLNDSDIRFDTNTGNKLICFITYNG
jgi:hypothetical protein